jgi:predicted nucleic acid-binding protein
VKTYIDSSALVPVYVPERFSDAARSAVRLAGQVPFTVLHRLEVANAFALLAGRKLLTKDEHRAVLAQLGDDLDQQRLVAVSLDLDQVFAGAGELSRLHSAKFVTRSLDLLHVAAAHAARCTTFVSADDRQLRLASAVGLAPLDIKRRGRRRRTER